jgi:hypothetical protein
VRERSGYIYVAPYYDYYGGRYVYRSGYWSRRDRLPRNVHVRTYRDGRPSVYVPHTRDYRARRYHDTYVRDRRPTRDQRTYDRRTPTYDRRTPVRDQRSYDRQPTRDQRNYDRRTPVRDQRQQRPPTRDRRDRDDDNDRDRDRDRDDGGHYKRRGGR